MTSTNEYQYAPARLCDSCLQVDGHPRHTQGLHGVDEAVTYTDEQRQKVVENCGGDSVKLAAAMRDLMDTGTIYKHLDCCLADGCPTGACNSQLDDPDHPFDNGKTTGLALSKKLAARVEQLSKES